MDNFQWTEDNLYEFMNSLWGNDKFDKEDFKKELDFYIKSVYKKSKEKKEYEILSFRFYQLDEIVHKNLHGSFGVYNVGESEFLNSSLHSIYSVKRLSDGEIFSVGDKLEGFESNIIDAFWTNYNGNQLWVSTNAKENFGCSLDVAKKAKEVLFTTEDGVTITNEKQVLFGVTRQGTWYTWEISCDVLISEIGEGSTIQQGKHFSTKEARDEYILMNKPILNLNDILNAWSDENNPNYYKSAPLFKRFLKAAKEKL